MQRWTLEGAWGTAWFFWAGKTCIGEEHRTEAAEVTEGDAALDAEGAWCFGGEHGFWAGKTRLGESIAQRPRRSQRGMQR